MKELTHLQEYETALIFDINKNLDWSLLVVNNITEIQSMLNIFYALYSNKI